MKKEKKSGKYFLVIAFFFTTTSWASQIDDYFTVVRGKGAAKWMKEFFVNSYHRNVEAAYSPLTPFARGLVETADNYNFIRTDLERFLAEVERTKKALFPRIFNRDWPPRVRFYAFPKSGYSRVGDGVIFTAYIRVRVPVEVLWSGDQYFVNYSGVMNCRANYLRDEKGRMFLQEYPKDYTFDSRWVFEYSPEEILEDEVLVKYFCSDIDRIGREVELKKVKKFGNGG